MKITGKKEYILPVIFTLLCITTAVILAVVFIPGAISYTVSTSENHISSSESSDSYEDTAVYTSIYGIEENGPFEILPEGENIFIFSGEKRLYRVKALFSDFPENDRSAISSGLKISGKAELYEIVQYLES